MRIARFSVDDEPKYGVVESDDPEGLVGTVAVLDSDPLYRPDPIGKTSVAELAAATDGVALPEGDPDRVVSVARRLLGDGPHAAELEEQRKLSLAPFLAVAALAPLGLLFWRRNV